VSELAGLSLSDYLEKQHQDKIQSLRPLLMEKFLLISKKLFDAGYHHSDNHFGNILIDPQTLHLKFIDVDLKPIKEMKSIKSWKDMVQKLNKDFTMYYKLYDRSF
jgi:hypothetical protein